jgi:hypothetical protein
MLFLKAWKILEDEHEVLSIIEFSGAINYGFGRELLVMPIIMNC